MRIEVLASAQRARASALWRDVERAYPAPPLAVTWRWTATWLEHFGDVVPHRFVAVHDVGAPVAVALVTRETTRVRGVPLRRLHLGTAGEPPGSSVVVERNAVLALPSRRADALRALGRWLAAQPGSDEVVLDAFLPGDARALAAGDPALHLREEPSPVAELARARDARVPVLDVLRPGPRRRVRRSLRAFGDLETEWAEESDHAQDVYRELVELHTARWRERGHDGAFATSRCRDFHAALIQQLLEEQQVVLFRVRGKDVGTVGCVLCYVEGRRVLFYNSGFGRFLDNARRPGLTTHALCMQACLDRGFDTYDFLLGDTRYKRELSTQEDVLVQGRAEQSTLRGLLLRAARRRRRARV